MPIYDNIVLDNSRLDGRLESAPSHFKENFKIMYLTEKMRSKEDEPFSHLCDRVAANRITPEDEEWFKTRVIDTENEKSNDIFKYGKLRSRKRE